ncbi:MAG: PAS domain S-box protein, partial [Methylovulum sp.]
MTIPPDPAPKQAPPKRTRHEGILAVVLIYAVFAACWILLSDKLVQMIFTGPEQIILASILKGWLFVGVTTLLLYGLLRRWAAGDTAPKTRPACFPQIGWPHLALAAIIIVFTASAIIHSFIAQKKIAKLDPSELYAKVAENATWIGLTCALALIIAATGLYLLRQREQLALAEAVQQSQAERISALHLLAALADSSDDAIFAKDLDGRYLLFNRAASHFVGKPAEEVLGRDDHTLFPPEQAKMLETTHHRIIAENRTLTEEETLTIPGGERVFLATKGPLRDADNKVIGIFGIARDITERKQAEAALRASELGYRSLFENMMNGYAHCRMLFDNAKPQDFIYLDVNKAFETQTGLKDVIGRKASEVIPGICETDPGLIEIYGRVALGGQAEHFENYVEALQMWFSISVYSPQREHFVAVFDVITERKEAELALRRESNRIQHYLDTMQTLMVALDGEGKITMINRAGLELLGYAEHELLGRHWFTTCLPPDDENIMNSIFQRLIAGEIDSSEYCENEVLCRNGQRRLIAWHNALLSDEAGQLAGTLSSGQDITERKQAEQELRDSGERFRVVTENIRDAFILVDGKEGKIILWNPAAEAMFGYTKDEAIGRPVHQLIGPSRFHEAAATGIAHFTGTGEGAVVGNTLELPALRRNGEEFLVELSLSA